MPEGPYSGRRTLCRAHCQQAGPTCTGRAYISVCTSRDIKTFLYQVSPRGTNSVATSSHMPQSAHVHTAEASKVKASSQDSLSASQDSFLHMGYTPCNNTISLVSPINLMKLPVVALYAVTSLGITGKLCQSSLKFSLLPQVGFELLFPGSGLQASQQILAIWPPCSTQHGRALPVEAVEAST